MNIAWFTPFSTQSAIGKYSAIATKELSKQHHVDIWMPKTDHQIETLLNTYEVSFSQEKIKRISAYDIVIYNLGDHFGFHKDIFLMSQQVRGIIVLHDYVMHHFFTGYYHAYKKDYDAYTRKMKQLYGEKGEHVATESIQAKRKPIWDSNEVVDFPFFEQAVAQSYGVIVHSQYAAKLVSKKYIGPIAVLNHPLYNPQQKINEKAKEQLKIPSDTNLLITTGYVNKNRQIDVVLKTLSQKYFLQKKIHYVLIGPYDETSEYYQYLCKLVQDYHLEKTVTFLGYQNDKVLHSYLAAADICINLRNPVMETASWSVLEQMSYQKPVIVSNLGFYAELDEECVVKIGTENEEKELTGALKDLIDNPSQSRKIGLAAYNFVKENFTPQKYSEDCISFINEILSITPYFKLIDSVSAELTHMKADPDSINLSELAGIMYQFTNKVT
jgi:glycosyltransferase involved in cell wall biosynthesis